MRENHRFLNANGERIFARFYYPSALASQGVVICHPMGEEKLWAHRVLVSFARTLAEAGYAAALFDFRGEGDSDREFEQSNLETRVQDTYCAIDALREQVPTVKEVSLVGLRLGASVATIAAAQRTDIARLILWDPLVDGPAYMQGVLRVNLMHQMGVHRRVVENREVLGERLAQGGTVNIDGYELGGRLFSQVNELRLRDELAKFSGHVLLVQIDESEVPLKPELAAIASELRQCHVVSVKEEAFWRELKTFYQRAPELACVSLEALGSGA